MWMVVSGEGSSSCQDARQRNGRRPRGSNRTYLTVMLQTSHSLSMQTNFSVSNWALSGGSGRNLRHLRCGLHFRHDLLHHGDQPVHDLHARAQTRDLAGCQAQRTRQRLAHWLQQGLLSLSSLSLFSLSLFSLFFIVVFFWPTSLLGHGPIPERGPYFPSQL